MSTTSETIRAQTAISIIIDGVSRSFEGRSNNTLDPADVTDADALEALSQGITQSTTDQHQPTVNDSRQLPDQHSILVDVENSATTSTAVIDKFPTGSPGAPIPGMRQGSHAYESHQVMPGDSVWAPFLSERDWEVARWAKMRGPTSSAVTELLAIPEVWASYYCFVISLNPWC